MEAHQIEPVQSLSRPPRRSKRIFHPLERYLGTILEDVEKIFLTKKGVHGDDSKIYDETISYIDSEK